MKRLKRQATIENITNKDIVQAFMLDLEKNYNVYSFVDNEDLVYELTRMENDDEASIKLANYYVENVNVNNFIDALSEIKGEQVKVADDEIVSLLRPIKRFYNYTDRIPYEIVKDDVEEAEDMIGNSTDFTIDYQSNNEKKQAAMEKIKLNEEQIDEYVDIITNFQHILNDILNSVENGEIDKMQLNVIKNL